jgi:hypothetical protein
MLTALFAWLKWVRWLLDLHFYFIVSGEKRHSSHLDLSLHASQIFFPSSVLPRKSKTSSMVRVMGTFNAQAILLRVREDFMLNWGV